MGENAIEQEIISIIADVSGFEPEEITLESKLADDLEIDSIKAIEIVVAIEKKYKVSVRDEDVPKITTVSDTVAIVNKLLHQEPVSHVRN
jgi:acyl carrier protein